MANPNNVNWIQEDEEALEAATKQIVEFLVTKDLKNIIAAKNHFNFSIKKALEEELKKLSPKEIEAELKKLQSELKHLKKDKVKKGLEDGLMKIISSAPGAKLGKEMSALLGKMRLAAFGSAMTRTAKAETNKATDHQPYNFFANAMSAVLEKKANDAENALFIKWYVALGSMVASGGAAGADMGIANPVLEKVVEKGQDLAVEGFEAITTYLFNKLIAEDPSKKDNFSDIRFGPKVFAIYLSGATRAASPIENARLALRLSLGMPIDQKQVGLKMDNFNYHPDSSWKKEKPVARPQDVAALFNAAVKGSVDHKALKDFQDNHSHITYLNLFLVAAGLDGKLKDHPFVLT